MKTTTHTDTTRAISPIAPATRSARSRAFLFLVAAACAFAPANGTAADISWTDSGPTGINGATTVTVSGGEYVLDTAITGNGTGALTVSGEEQTDSLKLTGTLNGYAGSILVSRGILDLATSNASYAGALTVSGGTVVIHDNNSIGNGAKTLNGGTLSFDLAGNVEFTRAWTLAGANTVNVTGNQLFLSGTGVLSGEGSLTKTGDGLLMIFNTQDYTGSTTVSGGWLYLRNNTALLASSGVILQGTSNLVLSDSDSQIKTLNGTSDTVVQLRGLKLAITGAENSTFAGTITTGGSANNDNSKLTKTGAGKLTLTNPASTYNGGNTISGGTVSIGADGNLGTENSALKNFLNAGVTLDLTGVGPYSRGWTLAGAVTIHNDVNTTQGAQLIGTGSLIKTGTGTLTLNSSNSSYSGGTTISSGTVRISADIKLGGTAAIANNKILDGATLELVAASEGTHFARPWTLSGTATISVPGDGQAIQDAAGVLAGTGANLKKTGDGTLMLFAQNTYTGSTTVTAGKVYLRHVDAISASSGVFLQGLAGLVIENTNTTIQRLNSTSELATVELRYVLNVSGSDTSDFAGVISSNTTGVGRLLKSGSGAMTLSGVNTYTGSTTINGTGSLSLLDAGTIASSSSVILDNTATFSIAGITPATTATILGLTGAVGNFVTLGAKTLEINGTADTTYAGKITGDGKLVRSGTGNLTLTSTTSDYSGGTIISGGTLSIASDAALGANFDAAQNILRGGALGLTTASGDYTRPWTLDGTGTITTTVATKQSGLLSGGAFTKDGSGTLTLPIVEAYSGLTTVSGGTLALADDGSIAASSGVTLTSTGKFNISGITPATSATLKTLNSTVSTTEVVLGGKTLEVTGGGSFAGLISGAGGKLVKSGTGTLTLTNASNSYTGGTEISGGVLNITADHVLGTDNTAAKNIIRTGGTLELEVTSGGTRFDRNWTLDGTGAIGIPLANGQAWLYGVLSGEKSNFKKTGPGLLMIFSANDYTGSTIVSEGSLYLRHLTAVAASSGVVVEGSAMLIIEEFNTTIQHLNSTSATAGVQLRAQTLTINGSGTSDYAGVISGNPGTLIKSGSGTLTLSGANTYPGATTVNGSGTLALSGTGTLALSSGVTLGGTAKFNIENITTTSATLQTLNGISGTGVELGAKTLKISGTGSFAGLVSGIGGHFEKTGTDAFTLTNAANAYDGGTTVSGGTLNIASDAVLGTSFDAAKNILNGGALGLTTASGDYTRPWTLGNGTDGSEGSTGTGTITNNVAATQSGLLSGTGGFTKNGTGTLTLPIAEAYSGETTVGGSGTLALTATGSIAASSGLTLTDTGKLDASGITPATVLTLKNLNSAVTGTSVILGTKSLLVSGTGSFAGSISGGATSAFEKSGSGTLALSNANNSFGGGTTISGGTLSITADHVLGDSTTWAAGNNKIMNGATLEFNITNVLRFDRAWTLDGDSTIHIEHINGQPLQYGIFAGDGNLIKTGAGTLMLYAESTYKGSTTVSEGSLYLRHLKAIAASSGVVLLKSAQVTLSDTNTEIQHLNSDSKDAVFNLRSLQLTITGDGPSNFAGLIESVNGGGVGKLVKSGAGTLTLSHVNSYDGGTEIKGGTVSIAQSNYLGTGTVTLNGGTLALTGETTYSLPWAISGTGNIVTTNVAAEQNAALSGSGSFSKSGTGTLTLSKASTGFSGSTTIASGTLSISEDDNLGRNNLAAAKNIISDKAILETKVDGAVRFDRSWTLYGDSTISVTGTNNPQNVYYGTLTGDGNLIKTGEGLLMFFADNSYTGSTTVREGKLYLRTLNAASASSGIILEGTAGVIIQNNNTKIQHLNSDSEETTFDLRGFTLSITGTDPSSYKGTISSTQDAAGKLIKSGAGKLTLSGANSYGGGTEISGGTVSIGSDGNLGAIAVVEKNILNSSTLELTGANDTDYTRSWTLGGTGGTFHVLHDVTQSGVLVGTGTTRLTKTGGGTLTLTGTNTYGGGTTISGGALSIASNGILGGNNDAKDNILDGGTLILAAGSYARGWTLDGTGGTISTDGEVTQSGLLTGGGSFTKDGTGILTLTVANTYTGTTTVADGTLILFGSGAIPNRGLTLGEGATFDLSQINGTDLTVTALSGPENATLVLGGKKLNVGGAINFTGKIIGGVGGELASTGSNNITLTGDSALATINVSGSTLTVNSRLTGVDLVNDGRVTITVEKKGILGGNGEITGDIIVKETGVLSPGNSPDTLTVVEGNVTLEGGATLFVEILGIAGGQFDSVTLLDSDSVFRFDEFSIISVNLDGLLDTAKFDLPIVTGALAFTSGIDSVILDGPAGWTLSLSEESTGHNLILHGTQVPEPGTYALFGAIGAVGLALLRRRRRGSKH